MIIWSLMFGVSVGLIVYTYALYPLLLRLAPRRKYKEAPKDYCPMVSIIVSAYNEEKCIVDKIKNFTELRYPKNRIEFLVGSDGSSDSTVKLAKKVAEPLDNVCVFDFPRGGKVSVLNRLIEQCNGEILVFSDANSIFKEDAIEKIVKPFFNNNVGCVSGIELQKPKEGKGSGAQSERLYWKYENYVKVNESRIGEVSGANGSLYALRAGVVKQIQPGIINDDFYTGTYAVQAGYDSVLCPEAISYEEANDSFASQFKRHVRDGAGHYQAIAIFKRLFLPVRGSFVFVSHRVIKWSVPFLLILALVCNLVLAFKSATWMVLLLLQVVGYCMVVNYYLFMARRNKTAKLLIGKILSILLYFFAVNLALLIGFWRLVIGKQKATWETQR